MTIQPITEPFDYLEKDHKRVAVFLDTIAETEPSDENDSDLRKSTFDELHEALTIHADLEEAVLYPALKKKEETADIALEAGEEHRIVKQLLEELIELDSDSDEWTAKFTVLKENVEHHVEEEEEDMFEKARKALSDAEQKELAEGMNNFLEGY